MIVEQKEEEKKNRIIATPISINITLKQVKFIFKRNTQLCSIYYYIKKLRSINTNFKVQITIIFLHERS